MTRPAPDGTPHAVHCPDCKAELGPELRTCLHCGADVGLWPESQRTPLILPGNPALSVDVVRKRTSIPKILAGTTLTAAILGAVLYYMPEDEPEDLPAVAAATRKADSVSAQTARAESVAAMIAAASTKPDVPEAASPDSLAAYSYGDTALVRTVPGVAPAKAAAPIPAPLIPSAPPKAAPAVVNEAPTVASAAAPAVAKAPTAPLAPARSTTTRVATATPSVARTPAAPAKAAPSGVLSLTPVVSNVLRPGERLQLRWSVLDRRTRKPLPKARVEFTSTDATVANVNALSGLVTARTPGTTRIIVDAGAAGQTTVSVTVRAPAPTPVVTVAPAAGPDLSRPSVATTAAPVAPPVAPTPAPVRETPRETPRTDVPDAAEIRTVVDRFVRDVRRDAVRNFEITQFLADGADHRVILVGGPNIVSNTPMGVRVAFDLRFTKFDGGGRPVTRVSSVTMDVDKRDGSPSSSAVAIGALRRP